MTKLRKQRKRKTYRYNVNRKRLRNKIHSRGKITCKEIKGAWEPSKSTRANLENMGLSYDPNKTISFGKMTGKMKATDSIKKNWAEEKCEQKLVPSKAYIAEDLEKEAKAPRERMFKLPKSQIQWITYLMDKYGSDYKAMCRDKKNHYQETWKQLRAKIKQFKGIPEQYSKYLEERGIANVDTEENIACSDDDD